VAHQGVSSGAPQALVRRCYFFFDISAQNKNLKNVLFPFLFSGI
jgi:hypothetical protein